MRPKAGAIRKDGTRFLASVVIDPLYEEGVLAGFAKITRDITERETARNALLDSERNFRLLVSGVTDYALYMLDPEGLRVELERRRRTDQRLHADGNHRPAFLALLHQPGSGRRPPGPGAVDRTRDRPL